MNIVAISGFLLIGVSQAPTIISDIKTNLEVSELTEVVVNIQKLTAYGASLDSVTQKQLIGLKVFPEDRSEDGTTLKSRWGGDITATPAAVGGSTVSNAMDLTYLDVPQRECINVIQGVESRFYNITVDGALVKTDGGQLDLTALDTACNAADEVQIVYQFKK